MSSESHASIIGRGCGELGPSLLLACLLVSAGCSSGDGDGSDGAGRPGGGDAGDSSGASGSGGSDPFDNSSGAGSGANSSGDGGMAGGGSADGGGNDDAGTTGGGTGPIDYVPQFPGAGTAADTAPLQGGELCDSTAGSAPPIPPAVTRCFFGPADTMNPAATIEQALECVDGHNTVHLRLTFDPNFNDNTFGANSIGWSPVRGHRFGDLVGSDHAELKLVGGNGAVAMQFKMDYIEADPSAPSGYATLGVHGGDGSVTVGDAAHVIDVSTSLDKNLNERGYSDYTVDSPATDESFTPNADTPEWDYRMVFEVWIDLEAFGDAGFAGAFIDYVHASPAKTSADTIEVMPEECPPPPCELPDGCEADNPCYDSDPDTFCDRSDRCYDHDAATLCDSSDPCADGDPDTFCGTSSPPPPPPEDPPAFCELYPTDPACTVE